MKLKLPFVAIVAWLFLMGSAMAQSGAPVVEPGGCGNGSFPSGAGYFTVDPQGRNCVGFYYAYANITTDTTTTLKSGAGVLHAITINNPAATETVTIYDNTSATGTKIGTITVPASPVPVTLTYDVAFATGLTIVTATAASDITVSYK